MNKFIRPFFYSNFFYGFCTVALSIESNLLHNISLNSYRFYLLIFLSTVVYYGRIYFNSSVVATDERTIWYKANRPYIKQVLVVLVCIIFADILLMLYLNRHVLISMSWLNWGLLLIIPTLGIMYTSQTLPIKKLRRIGWLKPFIIGFVWAGVVTILPVLFWQIRHPEETAPGIIIKSMIFLENFLFISTLAIIFDIKDLKSDRRYNLKTFPASYGVAFSIRFIIIPLALLSTISFIALHVYSGFSLPAFIIQSIPFILLPVLANKLHKEKSLIFYLAIIDGLMLLKAVTGIIGQSFF